MVKKVFFILSLVTFSFIVACQNPASDTPAKAPGPAAPAAPAPEAPPAYSYLYLGS